MSLATLDRVLNTIFERYIRLKDHQPIISTLFNNRLMIFNLSLHKTSELKFQIRLIFK